MEAMVRSGLDLKGEVHPMATHFFGRSVGEFMSQWRGRQVVLAGIAPIQAASGDNMLFAPHASDTARHSYFSEPLL